MPYLKFSYGIVSKVSLLVYVDLRMGIWEVIICDSRLIIKQIKILFVQRYWFQDVQYLFFSVTQTWYIIRVRCHSLP